MAFLDRVYDCGMAPYRYLGSETGDSSCVTRLEKTTAAIILVAPGMILALGASIVKFLLFPCGGLDQRQVVLQSNSNPPEAEPSSSSEEKRLKLAVSCFMYLTPQKWKEWQSALFGFVKNLATFKSRAFDTVDFFRSHKFSVADYTRPCHRGSFRWDLFVTVCTNTLGTVFRRNVSGYEEKGHDEVVFVCKSRETALEDFDEAIKVYLNTCRLFKNKKSDQHAMMQFHNCRLGYAQAVQDLLESLQKMCVIEANQELNSRIRPVLQWWEEESRQLRSLNYEQTYSRKETTYPPSLM